jgi:hypothetical protein
MLDLKRMTPLCHSLNQAAAEAAVKPFIHAVCGCALCLMNVLQAALLLLLLAQVEETAFTR